MANKKSYEQIIDELNKLSNNTLTVSLNKEDKFNSKSKLQFTHVCGYTFSSVLGNVLRGVVPVCSKCSGKKVPLSLVAIKEAVLAKGCKLLSEDFKNVNSKILFQLACSCTEERKISNILYSNQDKVCCEKCRNKTFLTVCDVQKRLSSFKYGSFKLLSSTWEGYTKPIKVECNYCQTTSEESLLVLTSRQGKCKECFGSVQSIKEVYCNILLTDLCIKFQSQFYIEKYPFDFYLEDFNVLIEIDGKQHQSSTFKGYQIDNNDLIKNELAFQQGYTLIRVTERDNLTKTILEIVQRPSKA